MVQRLKQVLDSFQWDEKDHHFVLAVSGGIDSMVLLSCFQRLNLKITIAHYNYGFRRSSILEAELIRGWCLRNDYPFYMKIHHLDSSRKWSQSLQSDARNLRYTFLHDVLSSVKADFIVTAHHLNDNIETFLINALRGSGTKGLKGIPRQNGKIIRPLLDFTREEIDQYAREEGIVFIEDPSNATSDYLRNAIRNEVLPSYLNVEKNRNALKGLARSLSHLEETDAFLGELMESMKKQHVKIHKTHSSIHDVDKIAPFLLKRFLRERGFWEWQLQLLLEDKLTTGKMLIGKCETLQKKGNSFLLVLPKEHTINIRFEKLEDLSSFFTIDFIEDPSTFDIPQSNTFGVFSVEKLIFPLRIRNWIPGDRMEPMGMQGKHRKVKDVLTDLKIPATLKTKIPVLEDGEGRIIWIPNYARSRDALIDKDTASILCLALKSNG